VQLPGRRNPVRALMAVPGPIKRMQRRTSGIASFLKTVILVKIAS